MARFPEFSTKVDQNDSEQEILAYWDAQGIFAQLEESRRGKPRFVFYEGPPTANGRPGVHHVMARAVKDAVCRHHSMRGAQVERKAGWDTHGLPVEIEVEKRLGLSGKKQIEEYGVEKFNRDCRESVFTYRSLWEDMTRRMGYWLDLAHPYVTYENSYIESVWAILKRIWDDGYVYNGHKTVPYCPRCGTPLSSHELAQGYEDIDDPSVFVRFQDADDPGRSFLIWTTTPWTLPANSAIAVGADFEYVEAQVAGGERVILARDRLPVLDGEPRILKTFRGSELVGRRYLPPFREFHDDRALADAYRTPRGEPHNPDRMWRVYAADFVSLEDGTGIVHIAPAFGEDDNELGRNEGLTLLQPVDAAGQLTAPFAERFPGFVKAADKALIRDLKERGLMYRHTTLRHSYPHCWRCHSPLLYFARRSWFIATTRLREKLLAAHQEVQWHPRDMGENRFVNWIAGNVDWAISRDRYWGTPLPFWVCAAEGCGHAECLGSVAELKARGAAVPAGDALDLHKPQVDGFEFACPKCGGRMRRVPEVLDVWFDSGAMPFAQRHWPFENMEQFEATYPADFISEGIDQSRGWFYSLLVIGVFLTGRSSFLNVVPVEMILDKHGQRMHKSKGNAVDPFEMMAKEGADAVRWYLFTTSPTWLPTRFDRDGVTEVSRKFLATLRNTAQFFVLYANLEDYSPKKPDPAAVSELDRWILARLMGVGEEAALAMDAYELTRAARALQSFVVDDLSNWYVRRSRRRFWKTQEATDHRAAFDTLHFVLVEVAKRLAPFAPFLAEELYQKLARPAGAAQPSVHMETYSEHDERFRADDLVRQMDAVQHVVSLARAAREEAGIRVRQPLPEILAVSPRGAPVEELRRWEPVIQDEINVKRVRWQTESIGGRTARPNFRTLGKKAGKAMNPLAALIRSAHEQPETLAWLDRWAAGETVRLTLADPPMEVDVAPEDVELVENQPEGLCVKSADGWSVGLDTRLSPELEREGIYRELAHLVQNLRKTAGLEVSDRIVLGVEAGPKVAEALREYEGALKSEVLATELQSGPVDGGSVESCELVGESLRLSLRRAGIARQGPNVAVPR